MLYMIYSLGLAIAFFVVSVGIEHYFRKPPYKLTGNIIATGVIFLLSLFLFLSSDHAAFVNYDYKHSHIVGKDYSHYTTITSKSCGKRCHKTVTVYHTDSYVVLANGDKVYTSRRTSEIVYPSNDNDWKSAVIGENAVSSISYNDYVVGTAGHNAFYMYSEMYDLPRDFTKNTFRIDVIQSKWLDSKEQMYQSWLDGKAWSMRIVQLDDLNDTSIAKSLPTPKHNEIVFVIKVSNDVLDTVKVLTYANNQNLKLMSIIDHEHLKNVTVDSFLSDIIKPLTDQFTMIDTNDFEYLKNSRSFQWIVYVILSLLFVMGIVVSLMDDRK